MKIQMKVLKSQVLHIRITPELKKKLEKIAKQHNVSVSFLCEQILAKTIE